MNRRELHRVVSDLLPVLGEGETLLRIAVDAKRAIRGLPATAMKGNFPESFVGLLPLLSQDDALGQIYQAINSPALENAYRATARERRKFSADEIPAVTQLFTPKWVVEFLLHNSLVRLWRQMHPDSRLRWHWLVNTAVAPQSPRRAIDLRICDPACGTMNFGLVAVEMLREMYREEIDRAGSPGWLRPSCENAREIDQAIIRHNLFGFDIDPVAIDLARQTLEIKIGAEIREHHLHVADALFDLNTSEHFDVVVTNPPYLSARNLNPDIVKKLKKTFPSAWRDYYACFLLKSLQLLRPGGMCGILCMHSFMFTGAFEKLRRGLSETAEVRTAAHFGPGLFDIGNPGTLQTVAIVLEKKSCASQPALFFRLVDANEKESALKQAVAGDTSPIRFEISQHQLVSSPRLAWMYWLGATEQRIFHEFPTLGQIAPPRQGLATTDNQRFVRYWWEIEPPRFAGPRSKWISYAKGGRFCRWHESPRHRVDWEENGRRIKHAIVDRYPYLNGQWSWVAKNSEWYGKSGISYSYLTSGRFSARQLQAGTFFDVAGSSLFPEDPLPILGILNSSTAQKLLSAINPTINFQVGDLRLLPLPHSFGDELRGDVQSAIDLATQLDGFDETSSEFDHPASWEKPGEISAQLAAVENRIDQVVARLYGLKPNSSPIPAPPTDRRELARRWISYVVGIHIGRWSSGSARRIIRLAPMDRALLAKLREILRERAGPAAADEIETTAGGMERFLTSEFLPWHNRLYRGRPVFWGFSNHERIQIIHVRDVHTEAMEELFHSMRGKLPAGWEYCPDDGVVINLAPLAPWIADRKLQKSLAAVNLIRRESTCESAALRLRSN